MWFTVNLLFKSTHPEHPENEFLWEERCVLVSAETEDDAQRAGEEIGKEEEHEYIAVNGDLVRWSFEGVKKVYAIDSPVLTHRTELFSRFLSTIAVVSM